MRSPVRKPGYSLTRRAFWVSFVLAWLVIFMIVIGALQGIPTASDLAAVVIPSMIMLIAALLGIHRFAGSMDYRASAAEIEGASQ